MSKIKSASQTSKLFKFSSLFVLLLSLLSVFFLLSPTTVNAQVPKLKMPCTETGNPEFNSLRPYQAAPCGDANKALFCSNDLKFIESFDVVGKKDCKARGYAGTFTCHPDFPVKAHNLYVELTDSMFPIMGNTEQVTNSQEAAEQFDDAQKVNEYASWYLSGVNSRAEYGESTNERVVNFSGPVQKLLPSIIQDAQRIKSIENASTRVPSDNEDVETPEESSLANHNQIVVCAESNLGIIGDITGLGSFKPTECYSGDGSRAKGAVFRLVADKGGFAGDSNPNNCSYVCRVPESVECKRCLGEGLTPIVGGTDSWEGNLSFWNSFIDRIVGKIVSLLPLVPQEIIRESVLNHWNKKIPPLPWENDPFASPEREMTLLEYQKYYNEWRGKTCVIIPLINQLLCFENILVPNKYADLYPYIPLSNTTDKKGAENILDVQFHPSNGTSILDQEYNVGGQKNAPLYFAHTQEVKELSELLNKTFTPLDFESKPLPKSTETNACSAVNIRTNPGDDLFPGDRTVGDTKEIIIPGVKYTITEAQCKETYKIDHICNSNQCGPITCCDIEISDIECNAEVAIVVKTNVKTPNANEIFSTTVADSGSTFRKMFPKVGEGAPVTCIADIPTVTSVTYNAEESDVPDGGSLEFQVKKYPEDGGSETPQLTFPHVGSVYEYFLKGIQTALRPKGYGETQPISAQTCTNISCGELPKTLPKATGSCNLGSVGSMVGEIPKSLKDIISAAAQTYKVPPNLILGIMYGEGLFNPGRFAWTDLNVKNWATCQPIPNCRTDGADNFMGFYPNTWSKIKDKIAPELKKLDPTRKVPSQCNLLDSIYGIAWSLHDSADGGGGLPNTCFGIPLRSTVPTTCSWNDSQFESAIKVAGSGYTSMCLTKENSCLTGGGAAAACGSGDTCETKDARYANSSHNGCVWDVAHGK